MEELILQQPELIGREEELKKLMRSLDNAIAGKGSTIFISGEAGIGKTRLVSELIKYGGNKVHVIQGWCLAESLEPLMPLRTALRDAGMLHLVSGEPPSLVVSAYLMNEAGILIAKAEREEMDLDSDIFASMLQAVGSFVKDSLSMIDDVKGNLNSLGYGDYTILIQIVGKLTLATVIKGVKSEFLIEDMKKTLKDIGNEFDDWTGDLSITDKLQPSISWFVDSGKYDGKFLVDDPKIKQENLFDNVLLGIQRASGEKPVLLFLDDMQWADPTTLNLMHYLARNTRKNQALILGTYRPEDIVESKDEKAHQLEAAMQSMSREELLEKIELKRLGSNETEKVIMSALGKTSFDQSFHDKIYKETEGTPFFVLEVVKLLVEEHAIAHDKHGVWKLNRDIERIDIPAKVYDVVKKRLDRLKKEQKNILECASVVGEEFRSDIVGKVLEINRLQLLKNLGEIENKHRLIHSFHKKYKFDHAKIREALYNDIIDELKQEYHRIIADTLVQLHKNDLDEVVGELAHHYYKAGDERAGEYLVKAGKKAKEKYANEEAVQLFLIALGAIKTDRERSKILEDLGDIQSLTGEYDKAIETFQKAKVLSEDCETTARMLRKVGEVHEKKGEYDRSFEALADAEKLVGQEHAAELGRIYFSEGNCDWRKGDYDKALRLYEKAITLFEKSGADKKDIGNALRAIGNVNWSRGEYDQAHQCYSKSMAAMESINDKCGMASALNNLGIVHWTKGEMEKALEFHELSLEMREKVGDKNSIALSLINLGNVYIDRGEMDRALHCYERSLGIQEKIGDRQGSATSLNNIGNVWSDKGEIDKALEYYERSVEIKEKIGDRLGIAMSLHNIANEYFNKGEMDRALAHLERCLDTMEKIGNKQGVAVSLNSIGNIYQYKGEPERALKNYERSLGICLEIGEKKRSIASHYGLAETHLRLGNTTVALEHAKKAIEISVESGAKKEEGLSHRTSGMVYRETKDWDEASREFEKAGIIFEEVGDKRELSCLLYERALLSKAIGDPSGARAQMEKALSEFERMGMKHWAEKARKGLERI